MRQPPILTLFALILLYHPLPAKSEEVNICHHIPLFDKYEKGGMVQYSQKKTISIKLVADLHASDCGAPDCYGTNITINITPEKGYKGCIIRNATVVKEDYFEKGCFDSATPATNKEKESFFIENHKIDISDSSLKGTSKN